MPAGSEPDACTSLQKKKGRHKEKTKIKWENVRRGKTRKKIWAGRGVIPSVK